MQKNIDLDEQKIIKLKKAEEKLGENLAPYLDKKQIESLQNLDI